MPFPFELFTFNDFREVDIEQAGVLPLDLGQSVPEGAPSCLEGLREPLTTLGTLELMGDERRLRQHLAELLPHECIERWGPDIAGNTALSQGRPQRVRTPPAPIIAIPGSARTSRTG